MAAIAALLAGCVGSPGPASPASRYVCVANTSGVPEPRPSIAEDAREVCRAVGAAPTIGALTADEVKRAFAAKGTRVAFYTGHGKRAPAKAGGVELRVEREEEPLSASDLLAALVGDRPAGAPGYRIALLNTCDSGYVALPVASRSRDAPLPILGLIASGYGRVGRSAASGSPNTAFGVALSQALEGAADRNCDAVVTDEEATAFVASQLQRAALENWKEWELRPTVVMKRTVDFALPVAAVRAPGGCSPPDWNAVERRVPEALVEPLKAELGFLRGSGPPPAGPHRFLVLAKSELQPAEFDRASFVERLTELAERLGYRVVDAPALALSDLASGLQTASFLNVPVVEVARSPFGDLYIELSLPRERTILWGAESPLPVTAVEAPRLAEKLARRLRRRLELIGLELGGSKRLFLRVEGEVPRTVRALPWDAFLLGNETGVRPIVLIDPRGDFQAAVSPCPGAVGQCFVLEEPELSEDPASWVLLPEAT